MRVTAVEPLVVNAGRKNWVFVKVGTDNGLVGWGEASLENREATVAKAVEEAGRYLIGKDPGDIERHCQALTRDLIWSGGPVLASATGGLEMALWDIVGKNLGVPVYRLLGGRVHDAIPVYANAWYLGARTPDEYAEKAVVTLSQGFSAMKWDPFGSAWLTISRPKLRLAVECVRQVREAVGQDTELMIEGHGRFAPSAALAIAREIAPYRPEWFEEPIPPHSWHELAALAQTMTIPIAAGERIYTRRGFLDFLALQAAAVLQPDICHVGGILEAKKIAAIAEAHDILFAPHNSAGPVYLAAAAHLCATVPNFVILEAMLDSLTPDGLLVEPLRVEQGQIFLPERPGLGIEINEDEARKRPYRPVDLNLFSPVREIQESADRRKDS